MDKTSPDSTTQITIELNEKCCPEVNPTQIGKSHAVITWTRKDGKKIESVDIQDQLSYFENGKPDGNDWTVKYNGSSGSKTWSYSTRCSDGGCSDVTGRSSDGVDRPTGYDREPPQMNNEGG